MSLYSTGIHGTLRIGVYIVYKPLTTCRPQYPYYSQALFRAYALTMKTGLPLPTYPDLVFVTIDSSACIELTLPRLHILL
jgi:hypothetical protein